MFTQQLYVRNHETIGFGIPFFVICLFSYKVALMGNGLNEISMKNKLCEIRMAGETSECVSDDKNEI